MDEDSERIANETESLQLLTDNCTNMEAYLNYTLSTGLIYTQMNISREFPIDYAYTLNGLFMPILIVITMIANTLVVLVLAKRKMRSPTNTVLLCMALSDLFTVIPPAPWLLYMYTFGNHSKPFQSVPACYAYVYMSEVLPNFFHTSSIWLTMALAIQRYVYVCRVVLARVFCTIPHVLKAIAMIYGLAAVHQSTRFFDITITESPICWEGQIYLSCKKDMAYWVTDIVTPDIYFNIYYWFRVICIHLGPCITLLTLNILLFQTLKEARATRAKLFSENSNAKHGMECKRMRDSQCTTLMLIVVVTVFLLVEIPLAVLTVLHIVSSSVVEFLNYEVVSVLILFSNFSISASYPINFAIYCGMSRQFRETFKELFIKSAEENDTRATTVHRSSRYSRVNGGGDGNGRRSCTNETAL